MTDCAERLYIIFNSIIWIPFILCMMEICKIPYKKAAFGG